MDCLEVSGCTPEERDDDRHVQRSAAEGVLSPKGVREECYGGRQRRGTVARELEGGR